MTNSSKIPKKQICEQISQTIESLLRKKVDSFEEYKKEVLKFIDMIKDHKETFDQIIRNFEKESKMSLYKRKLNQMIQSL